MGGQRSWSPGRESLTLLPSACCRIQFLGNCLKIVIGCLERFIRFLGHLAYIETAIYGTGFCRSVVKAFIRLVKNVIRFSFVTLFSKLVLLLGKLLVIFGAVWVSMLCIAYIYPDPDPNTLPGASMLMPSRSWPLWAC